MLAINNLSYFIGDRALYDEASLHIKPGNKIGLIGPNGAGKSTLLRLITGEYTPDSGSISKSNDCSIGFLNQDLLSFQSDDSIVNVAMEAFEEAMKVQKKLDEVLKKMETEYTDELLESMTKLQERFEMLDGYSLRAKTEAILEGLGFRSVDLERPLREFSGGWRMRVMLAKMLLQKPSLLMLDEPTNHLDLPSIKWIEDYLRGYEGAVVVVSHDRQFLNNTVNMIVEVNFAKLVTYVGNYEFYEQEKELRMEIQRGAFENQQSKIRQTERFIERFKAKASKSRQVQSKVKQLDKIDLVEEVREDSASVNFRFKYNNPSGRHVINLDGITKAYGDNRILTNTGAQIERGNKIALIGANGKGKSTLLRIIAGGEPLSGSRSEGHNVTTAFYAQHQLESLNIENTILEELLQAGSKKTEQEIRNLLGCFLFSDDDVRKKIKVLSGGEKSRVALAKVMLMEANFLLLDEPTNHLDIKSINILTQALQQYEGTFVTVSHDRHFFSSVADTIWYIENEEIKVYPGTYEEFEQWMSTRTNNPAVAEKKPEKNREVPKTEKKPAPTAGDNAQKKQLEKRMESIEKEIDILEKEKAGLEAEMCKPEVFEAPEKLKDFQNKFKTTSQKLAKLQEEWGTVAEEIEG